MTRFRLDKWYLDCVTPERDVLVGYAATLRWGLLRVAYSSCIMKSEESPISQIQSLAFHPPIVTGDAIRWDEPALRTKGVWASGIPVPMVRLLENAGGYIDWECVGANCAVRVRCGETELDGNGYAEHLTMTIPPWKLPFDELRWGRSISEDRAAFMIWIDMRGAFTQNWLWNTDCGPVPGSVGDKEVRMDGATLEIADSIPLRSGNVAAAVLGRFAFLRSLLPRGIRSIVEDKRISRCSLESGGIVHKGTLIDEVVKWGRG